MKGTQITLREARRTISKIIASGHTATIAKPYQEVRGFIVPIPTHDHWNTKAKRAAFKLARARFIKAWIDAQEE